MNNTYVYQIDFADIQLRNEEVSRFMGLGEKADEPFNSLIDQSIALLSQNNNIRGGFVLKELENLSLKNGSIIVEKLTFTTGRMISSFLKNTEMLAVFVCTAGDEIEKWTTHYKNQGDLIFSYIIDATGSLLVEGAMDLIYQKIRSYAASNELSLSNRYSPGYCDWKVKDQEKLFSLFPDQFCGVSLSESCLMSPVKSVSGIIGLGKNVKYLDYICDTCKSNNCVYRKKQMFVRH